MPARRVPSEMTNKKGMTRAVISCTRKHMLSHSGASPRVDTNRDAEVTEAEDEDLRSVTWRRTVRRALAPVSALPVGRSESGAEGEMSRGGP